jgi:hypothetical protein
MELYILLVVLIFVLSLLSYRLGFIHGKKQGALDVSSYVFKKMDDAVKIKLLKELNINITKEDLDAKEKERD